MISLYVSIDGEQKPESEISDYAEFYERLRASETGATTSQPSVGDFIAVYEPLLDAGREIVSVHISAGISGTCRGGRPGPRAPHRRGQGRRANPRLRLALRRRRHGPRRRRGRRGGGGRGRCRGRPRQSRGGSRRAEDVVRVDTLEYLRRGGRIGGAAAWIGSALKIKPILTLEEEITPVERVRTRARAIERLRDYARQRHEVGADAWVVQHIQDPETAAALADDCPRDLRLEPVFISEIGAVLGAHVGPGLLGDRQRAAVRPRLTGPSAAAAQGHDAADHRSRRRRRRRPARGGARGPGGASRSAR